MGRVWLVRVMKSTRLEPLNQMVAPLMTKETKVTILSYMQEAVAPLNVFRDRDISAVRHNMSGPTEVLGSMSVVQCKLIHLCKHIHIHVK